MENVLEKIINQKKEDLKAVKQKVSLAKIESKIKSIDNFFDFKTKIINNQNQKKVSLIVKYYVALSSQINSLLRYINYSLRTKLILIKL